LQTLDDNELIKRYRLDCAGIMVVTDLGLCRDHVWDTLRHSTEMP